MWDYTDAPSHTLHHAKWVKVTARIRNNETGEIRDFKTHEILEDGEDSPRVFNWEENNYSCDCNRDLFFQYALGVDEVDDVYFDSLICTKGKYSVNLINPVTNEVYYSEF